MSNALLLEKLESALGRLEQASAFTKLRFQQQVIDLSGRLLAVPNGVADIYSLAPRFEASGLFAGTDWDEPNNLIASLVPNTLETGEQSTVVLDCLSQLRLLTIVKAHSQSEKITQEKANDFLTHVLALNLKYLFGGADETLRVRLGDLAKGIISLYQFILQQVGFDRIINQLINEIWRILAQRPIQVDHVKGMVTQIAIALKDSEGNLGEVRLGADRLVSALYTPTQTCIDDPGLEVYLSRLSIMDNSSLQQEACGFARAMHDVGLVSDYHAVLLRYLLEQNQTAYIPDALGLSSTGIDILASYQQLVHTLITECIYPETAQTIYGLAQMLENGVLHASPIAPALWRQIQLRLTEHNHTVLSNVFGSAHAPRVFLLSGVVSLLGQPLGIAQGNNPTCQSARAMSMWAYNDPDYLLHIVAQVSRYDDLLMHFEGQPIYSSSLPDGLASNIPLDTDPVSVLLVPHLDKIYTEMGRICAGRGEDPHRWINPEYHGWWVGREFVIAVDVATGKLINHAGFVTQFYNSYHPLYNDNQPVVHPQPVGIAVTDSNGTFIGWHAITLLRVALDQLNVMRCYFYNPNNDSGQNWGHDVIVSTQGFNERFGEASLPFEQFLSRLYIYHDDPVDDSPKPEIPHDLIQKVQTMAESSWAKDRLADS